MQGRYRSPMGIGQRIPPDESVTGGHGAYGSGNRSFGRGVKHHRGPVPRSQQYPLPPPPPSKEDIIMEAGRLAAEYLIAQGMLPPSSLPPRWQRNHEIQEFKGWERVGSVRTSALDRLSAGNLESGIGRRWYGDGYGNSGGQYMRGRGRKLGNYDRNHGNDWGRENRRRVDWVERSRYFNENEEEDDDAAPGYRRREVEYRGGQWPKVVVGSEVVHGGEVADSVSESDNNVADRDGGGSVRVGSSTVQEDVSHDMDMEVNRAESKRENDAEKVEDMETEQDRGGERSDEEKNNGMSVDSGPMIEDSETEKGSNQGEDLASLCRIVKVPTKARSILTNRGVKNGRGSDGVRPSDEVPVIETAKADEPIIVENRMGSGFPDTKQEDKTDVAVVAKPEVLTNRDALDGSTSNSVSSAGQDLPMLAKQDSCVLLCGSMEESVIPTSVCTDEKKRCTPLSSFPKSLPVQHPSELMTEAIFASDSKYSIRLYSFSESSSSACFLENSSKSLSVFETSVVTSDARLNDGYAQEKNGENKRPRDWCSDIIEHVDDYASDHNSNPKRFDSQSGRLVADAEMVEVFDREQNDCAILIQGTESVPQVKLADGGQLLSSSFKIRDLNLTGTPEMTDILEDTIEEHVPDTGSISQNGNAPSMEFDLPIANNNDSNDVFSLSSANNVVQVIDLEDDSPIGDVVCDPSKPRSEMIYGNLESFLNNPVPVDLPDLQDGYGQAITDLLGSDIASPAVAADINGLPPGMTLHGGEVMEGVDDSLFSLGEMPIGFMDIWGLPPHEYGKYF